MPNGIEYLDFSHTVRNAFDLQLVLTVPITDPLWNLEAFNTGPPMIPQGLGSTGSKIIAEVCFLV